MLCIVGFDLLEGPPFLAPYECRLPSSFFFELFFTWWCVAGIGRTFANPLLEVGDDLGIKLRAVFRHLKVFVLLLQSLKEERAFWIAWFDGVTAIAAGLPARTGVEDETGFLLRGGAVALVTLLREDGANARLEEVELLRRRGCIGFATEGQRGEEAKKNDFFHARSLRVIVSAA